MRRIDFDELPLTQPANGTQCRGLALGGRQYRLVEFATGFCEELWCERGHVGYCLAGELELEFENAVETYTAGMAMVIEPGDRHRARVVDGPVQMFLVEPAE
jgi:quercetin dioxygenase-like cupin family protein